MDVAQLERLPSSHIYECEWPSVGSYVDWCEWQDCPHDFNCGHNEAPPHCVLPAEFGVENDMDYGDDECGYLCATHYELVYSEVERDYNK